MIELNQRLSMKLIDQLDLKEHIEGGYFARTYQSSMQSGERPSMTSIFYMLTNDRPVGHFHKNKSDIMHYFHLGSPIVYLTISPEGQLEKFTLGPDMLQGHSLQLLVKGGYWKASILESGEFGLLSEAVTPGFDYKDMTIALPEMLQTQFPHLWDQVSPYCKMTV